MWVGVEGKVDALFNSLHSTINIHILLSGFYVSYSKTSENLIKYQVILLLVFISFSLLARWLQNIVRRRWILATDPILFPYSDYDKKPFTMFFLQTLALKYGQKWSLFKLFKIN